MSRLDIRRGGCVTCSIDGCEKSVLQGDLCEGHRKRKTRGRPVSGALRERSKHPVESMSRAAIEYRDELETLTNEEWELARARFRMALNRAYHAYIARLTGLKSPRAMKIEDLGAGVRRITFKAAKLR